MADLLSGIASSVLLSLLESLASEALEEVASIWNFKSDLQGLAETVETIQAVLRDAANNNFSSDALDNWTGKIQTVMYDADDLLDEFSTIVQRKKLTCGSQFTKKVKHFFSRSENWLVLAGKMSSEIKKIRAKFDAIDKDRTQFHILPLKEVKPPYVVVDRETSSFLDEGKVIGRDDDKRKILEALLETDSEAHMVILPIVGIGGLGKTTMAQFIFNDAEISSLFEPKIWACIGEKNGLKVILESIAKSATDCNPENMTLERLQGIAQEQIGGKKYLLVLDDVWEESTEVLENLRSFLQVGGKGCKVIVTSRSRLVAKRIGTVPHYDLECLSDEFSWKLFAKVAFEAGQEQTQSLVEIGKEIVKKCAKLPLAIRVIGALLRGEDETYWRGFKDKELSIIGDVAENITPLLKLSYHHLKPQLKLCFACCSLFPKDKWLYKETLCELWIAEGILISSRRSQESLTDVADRCYTDLVQKCFINTRSRSSYGNVEKFVQRGFMNRFYTRRTLRYNHIEEVFEIHDLMQDLAREVAGKDILRNHSISGGPLSISNRSSDKLRTALWLFKKFRGSQKINESDLIGKFHCVRMLNLAYVAIEELPDSLGNLIHLRYLNLRGNELEKLPDSITKLYNLQFLDIRHNRDLKVLPEKFSNLVNLRKLYLDSCDGLKYMPPGIGKLICLERLDSFVVGEAQFSKGNRFSKSKHPISSGLEELVYLKRLRGSLKIRIKDWGICSKFFPTGEIGACCAERDNIAYLHNLPMLDLQRLTSLTFENPNDRSDLALDWTSLEEENESFWKSLRCLRKLYIERDHLITLPKGIIYLTALQELCLHSCHGLIQLPDWIGELATSLKKLELTGCSKLESLPKGIIYLTALQELCLRCCHGLTRLPELPTSLKKLNLFHCTSLESLPEGIRNLTYLEELSLVGCKGLQRTCEPDGKDWLKIQHIPKITKKEKIPKITLPGSKTKLCVAS